MKRAATPSLSSPGWAPENKARIERFLRERGIGSPGYDVAHPPCATFDWDMTSIFNDVGDATFYYQIRELYLKLTPAELAATNAELPADLLAEYTKLFDAGLVGSSSLALSPEEKHARLDAKSELLQARDAFAYDMNALYDRLEQEHGPPVSYPWLVKLYANLLPAEQARLSELVLAHEVVAPGERCTKEKLVHPGHADWKPIEIVHGIVLSAEMRELYAALRASGFDVYVVTASFKGTVEPIAARYGVRTDHVIGIRLATRPDGSLSDEVIEPITYRKGKVENIQKFVPRPPLFAAGDSDTDVEMLLQPSVELRLILDRKKDPRSDIGKLYENARASDREHFLIQGRDDYRADHTASGLWNGTTESRFDR